MVRVVVIIALLGMAGVIGLAVVLYEVFGRGLTSY
jgi:hypothetical protein